MLSLGSLWLVHRMLIWQGLEAERESSFLRRCGRYETRSRFESFEAFSAQDQGRVVIKELTALD
jgi:hypothetical protein